MIVMKRAIIFFAGLLFVMVALFPVDAAAWSLNGDPGWKAGIVRARITPKDSLWMGGYAFRKHQAKEKLSDLWAKVLAIEDKNGKQAVLITIDLVGLPKTFSDCIRDSLLKKYNLSRDQILLNASHTHSGPVLQGNLADIYPMDEVQL